VGSGTLLRSKGMTFSTFCADPGMKKILEEIGEKRQC
jgi:hypothetical protein